MANYYLYLHIKLDDGKAFYIGKGTGRRAFRSQGRSKFWKYIVDKHGFDVIFLEENLIEEEAFNKESFWIKRIGRRDLGLGPLVNLTNGGDGASGCLQTKESKLKKSISLTGRKLGKYSEERIKNMRKGFISRVEVEQYTKDGIYLKTFESISEAKKETGATHINHCIKNKPKYKTSGGFIWKLKGDNNAK
jgi:hypothetical protein